MPSVVVFDLYVLFLLAIDLNEVEKEHKLIVDEIVLIHRYICKMDTKNRTGIWKLIYLMYAYCKIQIIDTGGN